MANKKNKIKASEAPAAVISKVIKPAPSYSLIINDKQALIITLVIALISYIASYFHTTFYQGEEGAQYMDALAFKYHLVNDPKAIMGNWAKVGWKLVFGPVAVLFGKQGVLILNCLMASFSGFYAYKLASKVIGHKSALPFILLISQTLWFLLAFKFYSEIMTAFLLIVAVYLIYSKKYLPGALILSYIVLLRQEFIFIIPFYAYLLFKEKQWIAFFSLGLFSILYDFVGFLFTGDIIYSIHESINYSKVILNMSPRQGFDHYFIMSGVTFSHIVTTLVILYLAQLITRQIKKAEWIILVPALGFFLVHCFFNWQAVPILTTTGGNLRYVLVVSPLLAVIATMAVYNMQFIEKKNMFLLFLIPFLFLVARFTTYYHNWIGMDTRGSRDLFPLVLCALVVVAVYLIKSNALLSKVIAGLCLASMLIYVHPKALCCDENFEQKKIAEYIVDNKLDQKPILQSLALMDFFYGKNKWDYPAGCLPMSEDGINKAKVGSIVIWDSHYAPRFGKVEYEYFQKNAAKFRMIKDFRSSDNRFAAVIFEKIQL